MNALASSLIARLKDHNANIVIIGLGYVGLPLAMEFVRVGFPVTGYDVDEGYVARLARGESTILDVTGDDLAASLASGRFTPSGDPSVLQDADVILICVPTPLSKSRQPDLSYIESAVATILQHWTPGKLVVLESTTYPGTTDEHLLGLLSASGLREGEDYFLAFSSERVDPGNRQHRLRTIPKVVGGVSETSTRVASALYDGAFDHVHPVSSARVAELSKLLENTFRNVNIALVNEFKQICDALDVSVWEVIEAANTKPFGFMPFYPGPGIGGHCIPLDPQYLVFKSRLSGFEPRLVALADQINMEMPRYTVTQVMDVLNRRSLSLRGARVLVVGVAYKPDVPDLRESPALSVMEGLLERGADLRFVDPHVPEVRVGGRRIEGRPSLEASELAAADAIVVLTAHHALDLAALAPYRDRLVDTRNAVPAAAPRSAPVPT